MIIFNYEPDDVLKIEHVCYYTGPNVTFDKITLMEVVKLTIRHPEAPKHATVEKYDIRESSTYNRFYKESGHVVVIEASQNAARVIEKMK